MADTTRAAPGSIARQFNDAINSRQIERLRSLMSDDHAFIDTENNTLRGKSESVEAWRGFFEAYPDYRNVFERVICDEGTVVIVGYSTCSNQALAGPALWTAEIRDGLVAEWRVYEDTVDNRRQLAVDP